MLGLRIGAVVAAVILLAGCGGSGGGANALPSSPGADPGGAPLLTTAPPHFTITDLGKNVDPAHINDAGAVVGGTISNSSEVAFLWQNGTLQQLPPPANYPSDVATWINAMGEIVGYSFDSATNAYRALRFMPGGTDVDLGVPSGYDGSLAQSVNDSGQIVGAATQVGGYPTSYTVATFTGANSAAVLGPYGGRAYAISNAGEIVGAACCPFGFPDLNTMAFTYPPFTEPAMPADYGEGSAAYDVNARGDVVGTYNGQPANRYSPVCCGFYLHGGTMTELDNPALPFPQGYLEARALNDNDWIVGDMGSWSDYGSSNRAFLYINGVVDLNTLIPASCGWVLQEATSINSKGQIVGTGTIDGVPHGFLLTPSP